MTDEPDLSGNKVNSADPRQADPRPAEPKPTDPRQIGHTPADMRQKSARQSHLFTSGQTLNRGFDAYVPPSGFPPSRVQQSQLTYQAPPVQPSSPKRGWFSWLRKQPTSQPMERPTEGPQPAPHFQYPGNAAGTEYVPMPGGPVVPQPPAPRFWEKQPYSAIAHLLALSGTLTFAWLLGILVAQILPGNFEQPPLQESLLRKSSRLTRQLWHLPQLWHSPTVETQIRAIPMPTTGPVAEAVDLSPIERQPLIDELNAVETEVLTLDRRLQTLEKRLGQPSYEGADVNHRINTLRSVIDPPIRAQAEASYEPEPSDPNDRLLDVVQLKITLPSDALFAPGESSLKDSPLLRQVLDQLVNYPDSTVLIRSYSDDQAGAEVSREYTLAQANAIARYLRSALPTTHRWVTLGGGQTQPITENTNALERQQNRRIEILVDTRS